MRSPPLSTYPAQCQQVFARVRIGHVITVRNCVHGESAYLSPAMAPIYGSRFLPTMSCGQSKQRPRLQQYSSIGSNIAPICRMAIRMTTIIPFFRSADNRNIKQNSLPGFPLTKRLILCQHNTNRCACADVRRLVFGYLRIAKDGIIIDTAISAAINFLFISCHLLSLQAN